MMIDGERVHAPVIKSDWNPERLYCFCPGRWRASIAEKNAIHPALPVDEPDIVPQSRQDHKQYVFLNQKVPGLGRGGADAMRWARNVFLGFGKGV